MFLVVFVVFCIVLYGLGRLSSPAGDTREVSSRRGHVRPRESDLQLTNAGFDTERVPDRWSALDDRQLTRLLVDNAPC